MDSGVRNRMYVSATEYGTKTVVRFQANSHTPWWCISCASIA